jgi:immune inhibitor A
MTRKSCVFLLLGIILISGCLVISFVGIQKFLSKDFKIAETISVEPYVIFDMTPSYGEGERQATRIVETKPLLSYPGAEESLRTLMGSNVPEKDVYSVNRRFKNISDNKNSKPIYNPMYQLGAKRDFWILNTSSNSYKKIKAGLYFETPHLYFWIEDGITVDEDDLVYLSNTFEEEIYPTDREFFGNEPNPGIDNDEHIFLLYAHGLGNAAGFFSSTDLVTKAIDEYSNQAEMFYLSADYVDLSSHDYAADTMAHEFQHLIHYYHDRNEVSWISEGFSELAAYINEYGPSQFDSHFASNPNLQLTFWPGDDQGDSSPHYGAAFMFLKYFLDRFGEDTTKALVAETANDFESVDLVLERLGKTDPVTGMPINGNEVFRDWTITNLINDYGGNVNNRYRYIGYVPPSFSAGVLMASGIEWQKTSVSQFGTKYFRISCTRDCTLELHGQSTVQIQPENPHSGKYYIWSNKGDESEMTLSKEFDFSKVHAPISMQYWTWYDIEKDYDYLYLTVSEDNEHWKIIKTPNCTVSNPTGANYGCGYSGKTNGWIQEKIDLSDYAGKKVTLKFEYLTDLAVNGEGLLLDDITISKVGYQTDFESDLGGWSGNGFVRIQNELPQEYLITYIHQGLNMEIEPLKFDLNEYLSVDVPDNDDISKNYLVISGITRFTQIPASFEIRLTNR